MLLGIPNCLCIKFICPPLCHFTPATSSTAETKWDKLLKIRGRDGGMKAIIEFSVCLRNWVIPRTGRWISGKIQPRTIPTEKFINLHPSPSSQTLCPAVQFRESEKEGSGGGGGQNFINTPIHQQGKWAVEGSRVSLPSPLNYKITDNFMTTASLLFYGFRVAQGFSKCSFMIYTAENLIPDEQPALVSKKVGISGEIFLQ